MPNSLMSLLSRQPMYPGGTNFPSRPEEEEEPQKLKPLAVNWEKFSPEGSGLKRYRQAIDSQPSREDFKPGRADQVGMGLAAALSQFGDNSKGVTETLRGAIDRPYLQAMDEWNRKSRAEHDYAGADNAAQDNLRMFMQDAENRKLRVEEESGRERKRIADIEEHKTDNARADAAQTSLEAERTRNAARDADRDERSERMTNALIANMGADNKRADNPPPKVPKTGTPRVLSQKDSDELDKRVSTALRNDPAFAKYFPRGDDIGQKFGRGVAGMFGKHVPAPDEGFDAEEAKKILKAEHMRRRKEELARRTFTPEPEEE